MNNKNGLKDTYLLLFIFNIITCIFGFISFFGFIFGIVTLVIAIITINKISEDSTIEKNPTPRGIKFTIGTCIAQIAFPIISFIMTFIISFSQNNIIMITFLIITMMIGLVIRILYIFACIFTYKEYSSIED